MQRRLEEVLARLKYPMTEQSLGSAFSSLLTAVQSDQALLEQVFAASQAAHRTNIAHLCSALHEQAPKLLHQLAEDRQTPVQFASLLFLRTKLRCRLIDEASRFVTYSVETAQRLKLEALATEQIREALPGWISEDSLCGLITTDAAKQIYGQFTEHFEQVTQRELLQRGDLVRPAIEAYFQGLVDIDRMPSNFQHKFMRKLARLRLQEQIQKLDALFRKEVRVCKANCSMDWDLTAESTKGQLLGSLANFAFSQQPDSAFLQTCLARVVSRNYPDLTESVPPKLFLKGLCRFYMGMINLAEPQKVCTDTELYHLLRRIFQALYSYPSESSLYESSFLNALNRNAAKYLKECNAYNENMRYTLASDELRSKAWQSADLAWAFEQSKLRYLSSEPSLSLMLHVPSPGEADLNLWAGTEHWDLARAVLEWKIPAEAKKKPYGMTTQALVAVPLAILTSWFMVAPVAIRSLLEFSQSSLENYQLSLSRARDVGALLGLQVVHRKLNSRFVSLLGHGVGAQVVVCCLAEVAEFNRQVTMEQRIYVLDVILLLGAADAEEVDWTLVLEAVKGRFINLFSSREKDVAKAFGRLMRRPIGCSGIGRAGVQDVDVADVLETQTHRQDSRKNLKQLLKLMNFCP